MLGPGRSRVQDSTSPMPAAIVFDIDNTLTPPREALGAQMARRLADLSIPFALAAGSDRQLLMSQFFEPLYRHGFRGQFDAFLCNGASRYRCVCSDQLSVDPVDEFSLRAHLGDAYPQFWALLERLSTSTAFALSGDLQPFGEVLVDREAMVNFAPIGRPKGALTEQARDNRRRFIEFDEQSGYRARLMPVLRAALDEQLPGNDLLLTLGGQTSFDIVVRGRDKSFAVSSLLKEGFDAVTYVGDALFPGGNDAAVAQFVDAWQGEGPCPVRIVPVDGWQKTAALLDSGDLSSFKALPGSK